MNRDELEKVLVERGWQKMYFGVHSESWRKGHDIIDVSDRGVELWTDGTRISPRMPWKIVTVEDGLLRINMGVEL